MDSANRVLLIILIIWLCVCGWMIMKGCDNAPCEDTTSEINE